VYVCRSFRFDERYYYSPIAFMHARNAHEVRNDRFVIKAVVSLDMTFYVGTGDV